MFTAVIPMLLVMKQADTFHEMRKHELELLDNERLREDLHVYVFPTSGSSDLTLRVVNRGDFAAKIVKTWINDASYPEDFIVPPMGVHNKILENYFTPVPNEFYFIKVTTDKGNIFSSESGSIQYISGDIWQGGILKINVLISYPPAGNYKIDIKQVIEMEEFAIPGSPFEIHKTSAGPAFEFYTVTASGTYHVTITKKESDVIYDKPVTIDWPSGPPVVWVFS